jgi:hypothetical protein
MSRGKIGPCYDEAKGNGFMSITLTPNQQRVIEEAIDAGLVGSVDEFIETAVKALPYPDTVPSPNETATGMVEENGLLVYRTGNPLPAQVVDEAIRRSREDASRTPSFPDPNELPFDEWMRRFTGWVTSHVGNTVVLPDEAMERESIYGDHGR